jgi:hypothetical protein
MLRATAIVLNLTTASWWIWSAIQVTSKVGIAAFGSSGGLLWLLFTIPPAVAVAALIFPSVPERPSPKTEGACLPGAARLR